MAYTSTDLDNLQSALASGELSVRFSDGREVVYRSIAEIKQAIAVVAPSVNASSGKKRVRRVRVDMDSGLE